MLFNKIRTFFKLAKTSLYLSKCVYERQCSLKLFCHEHFHLVRNHQSNISLDLGSSSVPQNPFNLPSLIGIDIQSSADNILSVDLSREPIPFQDNSVAVITAFHFIEHIPRISSHLDARFPFINLMNEIYRTLEPGGLFLSCTPAYPFQSSFSDPTHLNHITEKTLRYYFSSSPEIIVPMARIYGFYGNFTCIDQAWDGEVLLSLLQKI